MITDGWQLDSSLRGRAHASGTIQIKTYQQVISGEQPAALALWR
jgi:hypothetical protein